MVCNQGEISAVKSGGLNPSTGICKNINPKSEIHVIIDAKSVIAVRIVNILFVFVI